MSDEETRLDRLAFAVLDLQKQLVSAQAQQAEELRTLRENIQKALEERRGPSDQKTLRTLKPLATYFSLLALAAAITVFLIWHGYAETPDVSIEYNVGEIIGGILVGVGAAMAGVAYTTKVFGGRE